MSKLRIPTSPAWTQKVLAHFDAFLRDHASCERKAAATAMSLVAHYTDKPVLIEHMVELAREELEHFQQVFALLRARNQPLGDDQKDDYVLALRKHVRTGRNDHFLDRLVLGGIIEARGFERFQLLSEALPDPTLQQFYTEFARAEARHAGLFFHLAKEYFPYSTVEARMSEFFEIEAEIISNLPIQAIMH